MKSLPIFLLCILAASVYGRQEVSDSKDAQAKQGVPDDAVDWSELRHENGVAYGSNSKTPFTGWSKRVHDNGQLEMLVEFEGGKVRQVRRWNEKGSMLFPDSFFSPPPPPARKLKTYEIKDLIASMDGPVKARYLSVKVVAEGLASDFEKIMEENQHRIRHEALKVLGSYGYEESQVDGFMERVRIDLSKRFDALLQKHRQGDGPLITNLYFTQFVIQ